MRPFFKIILTIIIVLIICLFLIIILTSCNHENAIHNNNVDGQSTVLEIQEDAYGHVISKTILNNATQNTYIYTYTYEYINGMWICTDTRVRVLSRGGDVLYAD